MIHRLSQLFQRFFSIPHPWAFVNLLRPFSTVHLFHDILDGLIDLRLPLLVSIPIGHHLDRIRFIVAELRVSSEESADQNFRFRQGDGVGV